MRIIAGQFRGRRLVAPQGARTRPTTDRVREAWFSMIGPLDGPVLDLYAGTGALGLEAISRGATRAVFVESWREATGVIQRNAELLGISDRIVVVGQGVEKSLTTFRQHAPFQLIITDPPWTSIEREREVLMRLLAAELLTQDGQVVVGHPAANAIDLPQRSGLSLRQRRSWGDSGGSFYVRAPSRASV